MPKCSQFEGKGPSKHRGSQRFQEKDIFLGVLAQFNSFQLCESQCFLEKGSLSSPQMSAISKIRGHFFNEKVSEKGYLLILENDHTSYLLQMSGGTGPRVGVGITTAWLTQPGHSGLSESMTSTSTPFKIHAAVLC